MRVVADFHIHSKYAMATSKFMGVEYIAKWAIVKGVNLIGTGDCTHPTWVKELKEKLEMAESGLYRLKSQNPMTNDQKEGRSRNEFGMTARENGMAEPRFMITGEVACIYNQGGRCRRVHVHFWVPSFEVIEKINIKLEKVGKIYSDGRPVLGMSVIEFCRLLFSVSDDCVVVPAHIWTPWFGILGSKSGFDSIEECFGEFADRIFALETGLSSDPPMNWRLSALDKYALISNSDAHSGMNLMREANVFELEKLSYFEIVEALKSKDKNKFLYTIEYYPEEGMYHFDGHREHEISMAPEEAIKLKNICPVCNRELTIGVEHRICDLADRERGFVPDGAIRSQKMVPLDEILMQVLGVKSFSRKAEKLYFELVEKFGSEFEVLMNASSIDLAQVGGDKLAEAIMNVRDGKLVIKPGYDGVYGSVIIVDGS